MPRPRKILRTILDMLPTFNDGKLSIHALRSEAAKNPASAVSHFALGVALARTNRTQEAELEYETALRLAPEFETARFHLGYLQHTSGRQAKALATWRLLHRVSKYETPRAIEGTDELFAWGLRDEQRIVH